MNIIEQLGGYGCAKAEANAPVKLLNFLNYDELNKQLLEYRRQHNIFEVGDYVFHPMFGALFEIKRIAEKYVVASTKSGYETNLLIELILHATPEEIKAGKRL